MDKFTYSDDTFVKYYLAISLTRTKTNEFIALFQIPLYKDHTICLSDLLH